MARLKWNRWDPTRDGVATAPDRPNLADVESVELARVKHVETPAVQRRIQETIDRLDGREIRISMIKAAVRRGRTRKALAEG